MVLSPAEEARLKKLHPDLVKVVRKALELGANFRVGETTRSLAQQRRNMAKGVSWTMHSRHIPSKDGKARAVDLICVTNGEIDWDLESYPPLMAIVKKAARQVNVPVECGIDWKTTKDGPHVQLPWRLYP